MTGFFTDDVNIFVRHPDTNNVVQIPGDSYSYLSHRLDLHLPQAAANILLGNSASFPWPGLYVSATISTCSAQLRA